MRYKQVSSSGYWSPWQTPLHGHGKRNYRMACCDCGLVHEMQFRVFKDQKKRLSVAFRCARNNRATSAARRAKRFKPRGNTMHKSKKPNYPSKPPGKKKK